MIRALVQLVDTGLNMLSQGEQPWHSSDKLQRELLAFHESYAYYPKQAISEAKSHHEKTMVTIRNDLQKEGVVLELQYTGSTYEGIKVPSTEVEFDVMVVLAGGKDIAAQDTRSPLYAELSTSSRSGNLARILDPETDVLIPEKAASYFTSKLQRTLNSHPDMADIKLVRHGPAIQMDVYRRDQWGRRQRFYSVDMVPSFFIPGWLSGGTYYVAKGFKEVDDGKTNAELEKEARVKKMSWRKSFSLEEKDKIKNIDNGNKCRKQCMRMLKVLRDKEEGMHRINSYIIKTATLSLDREYNLDWNQKCLGRRFINVLQYLAHALDENSLPHFYVPEFNLLADFSPIHRDNMRHRLKELIRSEQYLLRALQPRQSSYTPYVPQPYRHTASYETDSDDEPAGAYSYRRSPSPQATAGMERTDGGSVIPALLVGGAALAAALWAGVSLLGGEKDEKDKDKK